MMLRELYRIGLEMKRERGPEWPVEMYEERKIRWEVWLTEDATLRPNGVKSFDPKDKAAGRIYAPDVYRSGKKPPPYLVVDKPEYVLGVGKDGEKQHEAYLALLDECACATGKQGVRAIRDYLSSHRSQLRDEMARQGLTENGDAKKTTQARDWINFKVGDAYPIEAPEISAWWAQYTRDEIKDSDEVCCISRIRGKVTRKFPVSIPVVELDERGRERRKPCRLASVDSPACKSYGFDKSDHAPMSHDAALIAGTALKLMLSDEESSKRLGDVNFAFWTREKRVRSGIGALISGRPEDEAKLADVKALLEGRQVYPAADKFYMLAITNTESRIVIRASIEAALGEVIGSFRDWSASVAVCGPGADLPSIWSLHTALQVSNERQNRNTAIALVERAFFGAALDRALYASVFPRIESSIHRRDSRSNKKAPQWRCPLKEHVSIIKLYLSQSNEEVKDLVALNESFRSLPVRPPHGSLRGHPD